jgi:hypothetical protein
MQLGAVFTWRVCLFLHLFVKSLHDFMYRAALPSQKKSKVHASLCWAQNFRDFEGDLLSPFDSDKNTKEQIMPQCGIYCQIKNPPQGWRL